MQGNKSEQEIDAILIHLRQRPRRRELEREALAAAIRSIDDVNWNEPRVTDEPKKPTPKPTHTSRPRSLRERRKVLAAKRRKRR